jgi:hypothetical protein
MVAEVPTRPFSSAPRLDKGFVEGKTYKNASLGLELTPDPELKFGVPEFQGTPGTLPLMVMIAAWGEQKWPLAREGTVFFADTLAYYRDDQRSTNAYMRKVVRANQNDGFEPVKGSLEGKLGGVSFARTDFFKKGPAYEVVFVRSCDRHALVFVFKGSGRDAVDKLIARTELTLDLSSSGCDSKTSGTFPK